MDIAKRTVLSTLAVIAAGCAGHDSSRFSHKCDPQAMQVGNGAEYFALAVTDGVIVVADGAMDTPAYEHCLVASGVGADLIVTLYKRDLLPPGTSRPQVEEPFTVSTKLRPKPPGGVVTVVDGRGRHAVRILGMPRP